MITQIFAVTGERRTMENAGIAIDTGDVPLLAVDNGRLTKFD